MKYSILGFDQNKVLDLTDKVNANRQENQQIYIDVDDLLILSEIADLENRKSIRKIILDDGQYSWISYNIIIDDLPILHIGKKQLSRKIDKLAEFNLIEMRVERIKGSGTFIYIRTGNEYEGLLYGNKGGGQKCTEGVDKNVYGGGQKCLPKDNITIQDNDNKNKEERDKSLSKKDDLFEECWKIYRRGRKSEAFKQWVKLTEKEKIKVREHIKYYLDAAESLQYVRHFERYLSKKTFNDIVVKGNSIVFDPENLEDNNGYHPSVDGISIFWLEEEKMYGTVACDLYNIFDGYDDDKRPSSARLKRFGSIIHWDVEKHKWIEE